MAVVDNFKGYYIKINGCEFRDPQLSSFEYSPALVQVTDAGTLASGRLSIKVLPHMRKVIKCSFPPMRPEQFRNYWKALRGDDGGLGMYLRVEVFNEAHNQYDVDTFYHNDLTYNTVIVNGQRWLQIADFELIGH